MSVQSLLNPNQNCRNIPVFFVQGFSRKGSALQFLERCEEASIAYEEAIKLDPNNEGLKKSLKECKDKLTGCSLKTLML